MKIQGRLHGRPLSASGAIAPFIQMPDIKQYMIAVDPGRDKCGLAVLDFSGEVIEKAVSGISEFEQALHLLIEKYQPAGIAVGSGTGSQDVKAVIENSFTGQISVVAEKDTTLEARELAWREKPPSGIWRILPKLFWPEPEELDSWAAVVIGRRSLEVSRRG